jgi:hypothetical protein
VRTQCGTQLQPRGEQIRAVRGEVHVPDVQCGQIAGAAADLAGEVCGAQQGVALLEYPLVVRPYPGEPRLPRDQQVVEVPAALRRFAAYQRQVLGREQHHAQRAEDVACPAYRRPAQPRPVRLARLDRQLDGQRPSIVDDLTADDCGTGTGAHERRVQRDAVTVQCGHVAERFEEVGLADPVRPDEHAAAGLELDGDRRVRPEVHEFEPPDVHGRITPSGRRGRRTGCAARRPP